MLFLLLNPKYGLKILKKGSYITAAGHSRSLLLPHLPEGTTMLRKLLFPLCSGERENAEPGNSINTDHFFSGFRTQPNSDFSKLGYTVLEVGPKVNGAVHFDDL